MDRPVIPDEIDAFCLRKSYGDLVNAAGEIPHRNSWHVPGQNSATYCLHKGNDTHAGVGTMTILHLRLLSPYPSPEIPLAWLTIKTCLVLKEQHLFFGSVSHFLQSLQ